MSIEGKLPLHTFLPSSTEVLPLPLAMPVVTALVMSLVVVVHLLFLDALLFLSPFFMPIAMGRLLGQVCGSPRDKVRFARGGVRGSLLKNLRAAASQLCLPVPVALVKDVRLMSGGC